MGFFKFIGVYAHGLFHHLWANICDIMWGKCAHIRSLVLVTTDHPSLQYLQCSCCSHGSCNCRSWSWQIGRLRMTWITLVSTPCPNALLYVFFQCIYSYCRTHRTHYNQQLVHYTHFYIASLPFQCCLVILLPHYFVTSIFCCLIALSCCIVISKISLIITLLLSLKYHWIIY